MTTLLQLLLESRIDRMCQVEVVPLYVRKETEDGMVEV